MKMTRLITHSLLIASTAFTAHLAYANPDQALIDRYNLAAEGDESLVDPVHQQLSTLLEQQGAKPLTMVYLGSTETLQGRDAFLPWNKMKYTEKGLATIDKGINMLDTLPKSVWEQERIQGLPEGYLARAMAAATYTSLPDLFNHFDRGYDLFIDLLQEPEFEQQPFAASAWVYRYAIQAALRAEDRTQAQTWFGVMLRKGKENLETMNARALLSQQG